MLVDGTTRLIVDLAALTANYRLLCSKAPQTKLAAVVKADAYGLGAVEVAATLERLGCRSFFVNDLTAAIRLRERFGRIEIFALHGLYDHPTEQFRDYRIIPVLSQLEEVRRAAMEARQAGRPLPVGLCLDTGLTRLGLTESELQTLIADPHCLSALDPVLAMTQLQHFAHLNAPENFDQLARFNHGRALLPSMRASIATSSALFIDSAFHLDLARPGSALYGLSPGVEEKNKKINPMHNVARLVSRIVQVRTVPAGTGIGYDATYRTTRPSRIAVFGAGFADGLLRAGGNQANVVIAGQCIPVVGRLSMSLGCCDVTDLPEALTQPGAEVELFGPTLLPDAAAALLSTTAQELLCLAGGLNPREYLAADRGADTDLPGLLKKSSDQLIGTLSSPGGERAG